MENLSIRDKVYYVKPDGEGYYFMGIAPVISINHNALAMPEPMGSIDEITVYIEKDENGCTAYTLNLAPGQFFLKFEDYVLKLNNVVNDGIKKGLIKKG